MLKEFRIQGHAWKLHLQETFSLLESGICNFLMLIALNK